MQLWRQDRPDSAGLGAGVAPRGRCADPVGTFSRCDGENDVPTEIPDRLPADKTAHVILDNYATHKQPKVRAWLARHPRWTFHFVPTSCSWLNAVEGFFAKLTRRRLKNGVFHSVIDLQAAINRFIKEHNQQPRPFVWRADPDKIIAAVRRGHQTLESIH